MHFLLLLFTGFHFYLVDLVVLFMISRRRALEEVSQEPGGLLAGHLVQLAEKHRSTSTLVSVFGGNA